MPTITVRVVSVFLGIGALMTPAVPAVAASLPTAHSWNDVVAQVNAPTSDDSPFRCFGLEELTYCLGFGFVDHAPSAAQMGKEAAVGENATGAQSPAQFAAARSAMPKAMRLDAELAELRSAWDGRDKARSLSAGAAAQVEAAPDSKYIMAGYATEQEKGYWCGPATFQSIDWADDAQKDTQTSWASDLGTTTSGTSITAMVQQTNVKTDWDVAAGAYIVQSVSSWTSAKFLDVHQSHLGDGSPAPIIEHPQLLKRYFPYLAFDHSGHFQVGRGYNKSAGTIGIFEVFNERRFNSSGNITDGPKNIPASAMLNATLANQFQNIGL
ncbi:C39 family peptidase [Kribbella sp. NBC_01505]|uniref:C39 family peptidase n=1 Tax=Kribbella sp. NBC_01505 TaxID=2903580 RepID=UPI003863A3BF